MSRLRFEIFGGECEPLEISDAKSSEVTFEISPAKDGFLLVRDYTFTVKGGVCTADLRGLDDGEFSAFFYTDAAMYALPKMKKVGKRIKLLPPNEEFPLELARRVRELNASLLKLRSELEEVRALIDGGKLILGENAE